MPFAPRFLSSFEIRPFLGRLSLGTPLAKSQKMADLGAFAKFVKTRLCRHFWSHRLCRNVVRWWHFMSIVISRSCHLCQGLFQGPKFAYFLADFPLVPPLAKSQKMADLGAFAKFFKTRLCGHFWSRRLRRNVF